VTSAPAPLALEGAEIARGRSFVLGPLDLELRRGEIVAVVGPNGAGKSTLLAAVTAEVPVRRGRVAILGVEPAALSRREVARRVALLRQQPATPFGLTALEVVLHGRWVHMSGLRFPRPSDFDVAHAALRDVDGVGLVARDFRSLSGGERQRVLIAKCLAQESPVLLLDEPTAGLDVRHRAELATLVRRLAVISARAIVLVTHDLDLAAAVANRAILLRSGSCVGVGPIAEVFTEARLEGAFGHPVAVRAGSGGLPAWIRPALDGREANAAEAL
jgi:iron complex transport system ATP-binding protein